MTRYTVYHHETKYGSHTIWRDAWNELKERTGKEILYTVGATDLEPLDPRSGVQRAIVWTYPDGWSLRTEQIRKEQVNG